MRNLPAHHFQDFQPYFSSLTNELNAVRDRIRDLVKDKNNKCHWPTDGHFKEAILRQVLRRHLPANITIGTGFVVNYAGPSKECDILVTDNNMPTLFQEGELLIVMPEAVRAVIEVKTELVGASKITEAVLDLAERKAVVTRQPGCQHVWTGLFVYEFQSKTTKTKNKRQVQILNALYKAKAEHGAIIDAVAFGENLFTKFRPQTNPKPSQYDIADGFPLRHDGWNAFETPKLAAIEFVASLIERLTSETKNASNAFPAILDAVPRYFLSKSGGEIYRYKSSPNNSEPSQNRKMKTATASSKKPAKSALTH